MIATLGWKEFRSLFASPLAWIILAVVQLVLALVFFWYLAQYFEILPRIQQLANPPGVTEVVVGGAF
jgi:ABC-2 type transport system permease protein